ISLLLSIKPFRQIVALEIQERLAELARRNVRLNGLEDRIEVRHADLRTFQPGRTFDVVFSNPPYIKFRDGHLSSSAEKSVAKHEVKCDILDTMKKTAELLKKDGRAYFIFTARREDEFVRAGDASGLFLHRKRDVLPREGRPPNFFLSQCGFLQKATENLPPLVLFDAPGRYSQEAKEIFAGRVHGPFA
ncbi:MAG: tRNA1(Val) (adenine(37)-N6)-methyltransferase, partial [Candidatus Aminicenantales bacterium]